ncbi:MAG: hypothetical protein GC131_07085 [Alphaproteobacteria bacterium]|nr:hypothetical protein [Alphaproteobacteria bacterium]
MAAKKKRPAYPDEGEAAGPANQRQWLLITLVVLLLVGTALWLSVQAAYENTKFTAVSGQVVQLLGRLQSIRLDHADMLRRQNTDLVLALKNAGVLPGTTQGADGIEHIINPWGNPVTGRLLQGPYYRFTTIVPAPACERMADFFAAQEALEIVQMQMINADGGMEAMRGRKPVVLNTSGLNRRAIPPACSIGRQILMALYFKAG